MSRTATALLPLLTSALLLSSFGAARAGTLSVSSSADSVTGTISVHWSLGEWSGHPTGHPECVGYDIRRRSVDDCGAWVRVNAEPFPRTLNVSESFTYTETPPELRRLYQYRVNFVDANRNPTYIFQGDCECAGTDTYMSCPLYSAPTIVGTLEDWGWAVAVVPCPGSCYPACYYEEPDRRYPQYPELLGYLGTNTVVRFYGSVFCCSVEGPVLSIHHYEVAPCEAVVPARTATWGQVKVLYK